MRKIYVIGIGGSGAKCVEASIFLHCLGVYGEAQLGVFLVDADSSNGNSQRTQINLNNSIECYENFKQVRESDFMSAGFKNYGVWNPLADVVHETNLQDIFNKPALNVNSPALGKLFDALYSPQEQQAKLDVGFRGRPPIGSIIMSRTNLDDLKDIQGALWQKLLTDIETDKGNGEEVIIHLFGSVFGGTGASGIPTLATLLSNYFQDKGLRSGFHLNASVLLPYFGFEKPQDTEQTIFAETKFFALNTQAALQYLTENANGVFDTVYLVGNEAKENYRSFTGGAQQQNNAHFVELYAAMAIKNGLEQPIGQTQVAYISRTNKDGLDWEDLPESQYIKSKLAKGVRFACAWLFNFSLELDSAKQIGARKFATGAPWFLRFFDLKNPNWESHARAKEVLDKWTRGFLIWAQQISGSFDQGEQLFRLKSLGNIQANQQNNYREDLSELINDGLIQSTAERRNDCLDNFKNQLTDQKMQLSQPTGLVGLAHNIFYII